MVANQGVENGFRRMVREVASFVAAYVSRSAEVIVSDVCGPVPPAIHGRLPDAPMPARYSAAGVAGIARNNVETTDFGLAVRHLDWLLGGLLLATSPRLDWATLLRRTYAVDVLTPASGVAARLRLLSAITESHGR